MYQQNQQKEKAFPVALCYQAENLRNSRNILCLATCLFDHNISGIKIGHGSATQSAVQKCHSRPSPKLSWKINLMLLFQLCDTFDLG